MDQKKPYPPKGAAHVLNDTLIHVLISSYRDARCGQTVFNIFDRAAFPLRMAVGIVDQKDPVSDEGLDCVSIYCALAAEAHGPGKCPHLERISTIRADASKSSGPGMAR